MTVHQLHHSPRKDLQTATGGTAILEFTHGASRESGAESRNPPCKLKSFGTKAETLAALQPLVHFATVPDLLFFSVAEWNTDPTDIILEMDPPLIGSSSIWHVNC